MILKNDEVVSKTEVANLVKEAKAAYPEFEKNKFVILSYIPELYKKSRDPENKGKIEKPRSIAVACLAPVNTELGVVHMRYCKNKSVGANNVPRYTPGAIPVYSTLRVDDAELLAYLYHYSPQLSGGKNAHPTSNLVIVDLRKDINKSNETARTTALYMNLLFNELIPEKVRMMGKLYTISDVDAMDIEILRNKIDGIVKMRKGGIAEFLKRVNEMDTAPESISQQSFLKDAEESGRLVYRKPNWIWLAPDKTTLVTNLLNQPGNKSLTGLYNHLVNNDPRMLSSIVEEISRIKVEEPEE